MTNNCVVSWRHSCNCRIDEFTVRTVHVRTASVVLSCHSPRATSLTPLFWRTPFYSGAIDYICYVVLYQCLHFCIIAVIIKMPPSMDNRVFEFLIGGSCIYLFCLKVAVRFFRFEFRLRLCWDLIIPPFSLYRSGITWYGSKRWIEPIDYIRDFERCNMSK